MDAARRGSDHHIIHIHLPPRPPPADGKDHKHAQPPLLPQPRPAPQQAPGPAGGPVDEPPVPSLARRAVRWLRGEPVVVGSVPAHECKDGVYSWRSWQIHIAPVVSAVVADVAAYLTAPDDDKAGAFLIGTGAGLAYGYLGQYAARRIVDGCAWLHERHHLRVASLAPQQQLTRIVELANAQPLTRQGLRSAVGRIQALHDLYPGAIDPAAVADAMGRLANGAVDLGPETPVLLGDLADALEAWQARTHLDGAAMARAFTWLAQGPCGRLPGLTQESKLLVLRLVIDRLIAWADGAPRRLPEAERVAFLKDMGGLLGPPGPGNLPLRDHAWQALIRDLPEEAGPQLEQIAARLALGRPDAGWLLDHAILHITSRFDPNPGGVAYQACARALVRLLAAVGSDFSADRLAAWIVHLLWPTTLRPVDGIAQQLLDILPEVVDAFGWRFKTDHLVGLLSALVMSDFFGTRPTPQEAVHYALTLVRPTMSLTLRIQLIKTVEQRWGIEVPLERQPAMAPAALLDLLRDMPVELLGSDIKWIIEYLLRGDHPLAVARHCLAAMDILAQRPATPGFPSLDTGLVGPEVVKHLIGEIASAPPDEGSRDRGEVIARLPQLCQRATTAAVVREAVDAILALPELRLDQACSSSSHKYPSEALGLVLQACTSPTLFIARSDESAQAQVDAQQLHPFDFLPPAPTRPMQEAAEPDRASTTIEHDWLTPAFIAEMTEPLTGQRESKHG